MHIVLHKILCERNSCAAKNTHGNFWPGVSKFIFSSASQSSHSLTKIAPLVTFSSLIWKGNVHHAFSCPKRQEMSQLVFARVVVVPSLYQSLIGLFLGLKIVDYADPSPQSLLMTVSSSQSHIFLPMRQSEPAHSHLALPDVLCCGDRLPFCLLACLFLPGDSRMEWDARCSGCPTMSHLSSGTFPIKVFIAWLLGSEGVFSLGNLST